MLKRRVLTSIICIAFLIVGTIVPAGAASGTSVDIPVTHKTVGAAEKGTAYITLTPKSVKSADGTVIPMPEGSKGNTATITIKGDGRSAFKNLVFDSDGIYKYEVAEEEGTNTEITYDTTVYTVTVIVKDGKSHLTVSKNDKGVKEENVEVSFVDEKGNPPVNPDEPETPDNPENPDNPDNPDEPNRPNEPPEDEDTTKRKTPNVNSVYIAPKVKKKIDGNGTYSNNTFNFVMTPTDDTGDLLGSLRPYKAKVKGEGTASFPSIMIDTAGTYEFTVKESQDHSMSWNYDETIYTYTVKVVEKGDSLVVDSTTIKAGDRKCSQMKYVNVPSITNRIYSDIKTGDPQQWMLMIVLAVAGLLVIIFIVAPNKR